jgi:coproporphyrinogen III oxidase
LSTQQTQIDIAVLKEYFLGLQDRITNAMSALDGKAFVADEWHKPEDSKLKGYGRTCTLDGGNILEKGGVGFSHGCLWFFIRITPKSQPPI